MLNMPPSMPEPIKLDSFSLFLSWKPTPPSSFSRFRFQILIITSFAFSFLKHHHSPSPLPLFPPTSLPLPFIYSSSLLSNFSPKFKIHNHLYFIFLLWRTIPWCWWKENEFQTKSHVEKSFMPCKVYRLIIAFLRAWENSLSFLLNIINAFPFQIKKGEEGPLSRR